MKYKRLYKEASHQLDLFEAKIDRLTESNKELQETLDSYRLDDLGSRRGKYCENCVHCFKETITVYGTTHLGVGYQHKYYCLRNVPCQGFKPKGEKENG